MRIASKLESRWSVEMEKSSFFPPFPSSLFTLNLPLSPLFLSVLLFVMDGYSLFCGLLTRVGTKFLICHTCLCSTFERPGTPGTGWSQTQTRIATQAWGTKLRTHWTQSAHKHDLCVTTCRRTPTHSAHVHTHTGIIQMSAQVQVHTHLSLCAHTDTLIQSQVTNLPNNNRALHTVYCALPLSSVF